MAKTPTSTQGYSTDQLLRQKLQEMQEEKAALLESVAPLQKQLDDLNSQVEQVQQARDRVMVQIRQQIHGRLVELDEEISRLARATGGRAMSENRE